MKSRNLRWGITRGSESCLRYVLLCVVIGLLTASWWALFAGIVFVTAIKSTNPLQS